jgi:hypothetical protein
MFHLRSRLKLRSFEDSFQNGLPSLPATAHRICREEIREEEAPEAVNEDGLGYPQHLSEPSEEADHLPKSVLPPELAAFFAHFCGGASWIVIRIFHNERGRLSQIERESVDESYPEQRSEPVILRQAATTDQSEQ